MKSIHKNGNANGNATRTKQAEEHTRQAYTLTDQANTRTDEANTRTDQANARTEQAKTQTDQANTRTNEANTRTERAETSEQALRASELSYRRLFESARDGILILDVETGRISDVNPFLVELLGFSHDEMVGKTVGELSPFKDVVSNQAMLERLQKDGYVRYEDLPLETRDGRKIAVEFVSNVYQAGDKKVIQCNIRDITERKRMEMILNRLAAIVESSDDAIIGKDLNSIVTSWNSGAEKIFGYSADEMVGNSIMRLIPADRQDEEKQFMAMARRGESVRQFETVRQAKDGRLLDVSVTISPIKDAGGKIGGVSKVARDITEQRKLEAQFRQAQKMDAIGQLAGGVAHDFNNILAVIQLQADLLKIGGNLSPEQLEFADDIGLASQRASALTRQLLLFSRKETLKPCDLDLNQSLDAMTNMLRRILGEDIQMQFKFSTQPLFIHADAGMMDQMLMNLAVNSRDAMPKGGQLVIETSAVDFDESVVGQSAQARPGSFVCLSVSDTGCGIPPENLSKIFEPFFTTKDVGKGTGLGLATIFGIVEQHQGWVNVYSEIGQGTTFRIYLPHLAKVSPQKSEQPKPSVMRGGNETILLVEDDSLLHASVRKILSHLGYRVLDATNGVEALEVWKQKRDEINLLLTDLVMPGGITGIDLAGRLLKENPKLKVIYASGYSAEVASKDFSLEEGVNFLTKPFHMHKLAQTVRQNLDVKITNGENTP